MIPWRISDFSSPKKELLLISRDFWLHNHPVSPYGFAILSQGPFVWWFCSGTPKGKSKPFWGKVSLFAVISLVLPPLTHGARLALLASNAVGPQPEGRWKPSPGFVSLWLSQTDLETSHTRQTTTHNSQTYKQRPYKRSVL